MHNDKLKLHRKKQLLTPIHVRTCIAYIYMRLAEQLLPANVLLIFLCSRRRHGSVRIRVTAQRPHDVTTPVKTSDSPHYSRPG